MTETTPPESPGKIFSTWLWNPFVFIAGGPALVIGMLIIFVTGYMASLGNVHFDGVLDTHMGLKAPLWFFLAEGVTNWLCLSLFLLIGAGIIARKRRFRLLDLIGTQALARWPFLITALVTNLPGFSTYNAKLVAMANQGKITFPAAPVTEKLAYSFATFTMIVVTVWFVALAWKAFRISTDTQGWKAITAFTVGIILAEVLSKMVLNYGLFPML